MARPNYTLDYMEGGVVLRFEPEMPGNQVIMRLFESRHEWQWSSKGYLHRWVGGDPTREQCEKYVEEALAELNELDREWGRFLNCVLLARELKVIPFAEK